MKDYSKKLTKIKLAKRNQLKALVVLHNFQVWRRGGNNSQPSPKEVGVAIDDAIRLMRAVTRSNYAYYIYGEMVGAKKEHIILQDFFRSRKEFLNYI